MAKQQKQLSEADRSAARKLDIAFIIITIKESIDRINLISCNEVWDFSPIFISINPHI